MLCKACFFCKVGLVTCLPSSQLMVVTIALVTMLLWLFSGVNLGTPQVKTLSNGVKLLNIRNPWGR